MWEALKRGALLCVLVAILSILLIGIAILIWDEIRVYSFGIREQEPPGSGLFSSRLGAPLVLAVAAFAFVLIEPPLPDALFRSLFQTGLYLVWAVVRLFS